MVVNADHLENMRKVKQMYAHYQQNKDLISIGAYNQGSDPILDNAIRLQPAMNMFLKQGMKDAFSFDDCSTMLTQIAAQC